MTTWCAGTIHTYLLSDQISYTEFGTITSDNYSIPDSILYQDKP